MRKYIIFSEDELRDLLNGGETRHVIDDHYEVIFVSEETYAHMIKTGCRYEEEE
jgi:hypothetical protein